MKYVRIVLKIIFVTIILGAITYLIHSIYKLWKGRRG